MILLSLQGAAMHVHDLVWLSLT
eukprot:COSAG02_NODE_6424_length_3580_cov_64.506464_1_plen_22_part_10